MNFCLASFVATAFLFRHVGAFGWFERSGWSLKHYKLHAWILRVSRNQQNCTEYIDKQHIIYMYTYVLHIWKKCSVAKNYHEKCLLHGTLPVRILFLVKYGARKSLFSKIPLYSSYIPLYTCTLTHSAWKKNHQLVHLSMWWKSKSNRRGENHPIDQWKRTRPVIPPLTNRDVCILSCLVVRYFHLPKTCNGR